MKLILNLIFGLYCLGRLVSMVPLHRAPLSNAPTTTVIPPTTVATVAQPVAVSPKGKTPFNLFNYLEIIGVVILFFSMAIRKKNSKVIVSPTVPPTVH